MAHGSSPSSLPMPPHHHQMLVALLAALMVVLSSPSAVRARPTALFVFGDSTVDTGNNNYWPTMARANLPPYGRDFPGGRPTGRFCNGRMPPDFYSELLGLGRSFLPAYLDPSYGVKDFAIGANFASAGSGLDDATSSIINVIPMEKQVAMFAECKSKLAASLGAAEAEKIVNGAVYAVSPFGINDYMENYFSLRTTRTVEYTLPQYTAFLMTLVRKMLTDLHSLGARKLGYTAIGPMGCLPPDRALSLGLCNELHNAAARSFNAALRDTLAQLNAQLPGADFRVADTYDFFQDILSRPAAYGFARADVGCCGTGRFEMGYACSALTPLCPDATKYLFWDAAHLTDRGNQLVANYLFNTTFSKFFP